MDVLWVGMGLGVEEEELDCVGLGVVELVVELDVLWVGSGVEVDEELLEVDEDELSAVELLNVVELELDVLEVDEDVLEVEVDEDKLEVVLELVEDELLEVLSSGLSSPQPVRSAAAKSTAKIVVFFIKNLLKVNISSLYHIFAGLSRQ